MTLLPSKWRPVFVLLGCSVVLATQSEAQTLAKAKGESANVSSPNVLYRIDFGPHFGGGQASGGNEVRQASGYALAMDRFWALTYSTSLGPRFFLGNSFVDVAQKRSTSKQNATFDNRLIGAGVTLTQELTFASVQALSLSVIAGRGYAKVKVNETRETTYREANLGGVEGNFVQTAAAFIVPLKEKLAVSLGIQYESFNADLKNARGTFNGDEVSDGRLGLVSGVTSAKEANLPSSLRLSTVSARLGLSLGF